MRMRIISAIMNFVAWNRKYCFPQINANVAEFDDKHKLSRLFNVQSR